VRDGIEGKTTVSFRFARELRVDCTAHIGRVEYGHTPSRMTKQICTALDGMPSTVRMLCLLVVDKMKRAGACWDRSGSIGSQLKAVNWVLLVIAWWRDTAWCLDATLHCCLFQFFAFYAAFSFEEYCIDSTTREEPLYRRRALARDEGCMCLADPTRPGLGSWNILDRVTPNELMRVREILATCSLPVPSSSSSHREAATFTTKGSSTILHSEVPEEGRERPLPQPLKQPPPPLKPTRKAPSPPPSPRCFTPRTKTRRRGQWCEQALERNRLRQQQQTYQIYQDVFSVTLDMELLRDAAERIVQTDL
jgi:hypothetical protein